MFAWVCVCSHAFQWGFGNQVGRVVVVIHWGGGGGDGGQYSMSKQTASKASMGSMSSGGGESSSWMMRSVRAVGDIQKVAGPGDWGRSMMWIGLLVAGGWRIGIWVGGIGAGMPCRGR